MGNKSIPKEFLGAFKKGHRFHSKEFIDEELSKVLLTKTLAGCEESRRALEWLTKFNNEYHKCVFRKGDLGLHKTAELKSECIGRDYAQKNDFFTHPVFHEYRSKSQPAPFDQERDL